MKRIDYSTIKYDGKDEVKLFVGSLEQAFSKFNKNVEQYNSSIKKLVDSIDKKKAQIEKLNEISLELSKKMEEFDELKTSAKKEISDLEDKKRSISYVDKEVQKMETDDIDSLINSKRHKIEKIDVKIASTKEKVATNNAELKTAEKELKALFDEKMEAEGNLSKTEAIARLIGNSTEDICVNIDEILHSEYVVIEEDDIDDTNKENVFKEIDEEDSDDDVLNIDFSEYGLTDITPSEASKEEKVIEDKTEEVKEEAEIIDLTNVALETLNEPKEEIKEDVKPAPVEEDSEAKVDYKSLLEDIFDKEVISFSDFKPEIQEKMLKSADRVIKNVVVLKKHQIPLELTLEEPDIYFGIDAQDLDDLLNIITVDEDGNGMGFTNDYTYYVLDELSKIDVDKLIDVYNNEFMNINSKSGLIKLLKLTNPELEDFKNNRKANIETLKSLGVNSADEIAKEYVEFINLDNPLFLNVLNIFDKDDLVTKMNTDISVISKIYEYWKNN